MNDYSSWKFLSNFHCSICNLQFFIKDVTLKGSRCPMLLHCGHSMCSSCIQQHLKSNHISCQLCGSSWSLNSSEAINKYFPLNIYVLGSLVFLNSKLEKENKLAFLTKNNGDFNYTSLKHSNAISKADSSDSACEECSLLASWHCENCKSNFCEICWSRVHGSAKSLTKHFRTSISEVSKNTFKKCLQHESQNLEFFCTDCSKAVCSHCVILQHQGEGHRSITLKEKNLGMLNKVKGAVEDVEKISKRIRQTLEKIRRENNPESSENTTYSNLENQITQNFSRMHGILQLEEERLLKKLHEKSSDRGSCLRNLQRQLEDQMEMVESLLRESEFAMKRSNSSNFTELYKQLTEVQTLPCYLISKKAGNEKAKVTFDEKLIDLIRIYCTMDLPSEELFELRSSSDLPEDYIVDPLDNSYLNEDLKGQDSSVSTTPDMETVSNCSSRELPKEDLELFNNLSKFPKEPKVFLEKKSYCVRISFIKNPGEFYVTLNSQRNKQRAIDRRASLLARLSCPVTDTVRKDEIYLVKYNVDKKWYRGRIMEVLSSKQIEGEECVLVYYLDYGNFETVPISRLKPISPDLLEEPPLAIKCKLFDCVPQDGEWCAESTRTMERILKNHTATMFVMKVHTDCLEVDLSVIYPEGQIGRDIVSVRDALLFLGFSSFVHGVKIPRNATAFKYLDQCFPSMGEIFDVTVTHINSPSDFYVQKTKADATYLYKMAIDLQMYYDENLEKGMIYNPTVDMPCAANFSADKKWYRAKIVEIPGKKMVTVFYVDFGNKETIQWTEIRKLKESFAKCPPLAFNCGLSGIFPINRAPWSNQAKACMKKNTLMKEGRIIIQSKSKTKQKLKVLLYKKGHNKDVCINHLLVDMSFAVKASNREFSWLPIEQEEGKKDLALENKSDSDKETSQIISNLDTGSGTKRNFNDRKKNKLSAKELRELHESEKKSQTEEHFTSTYVDGEIDEYKHIFKVKVDILSSETPSSIYVTFPTLMAEFEILQAKLNEFYQDSTSTVKEWTEGSLCAVFDSTKRSWFRASVLKNLPNDRVQVFLKDTALVTTEPVSALRTLDPLFKKYSTCAIRCHLANIRPPGEVWPGISCEYLLDELESHKEVYMTKRGQTENGSLPVELWIQKVLSRGALEPIKKEWITLNRLLVSQGLAIPVKPEMWSGWEISTEEEYSDEENPSGSIKPPSDKEELETSEAFVPSLSSEWIPPLPLQRSRFIGVPTYVDFNAIIYMYDTEEDEEKLKTIREVLLKEYENSKPCPEDHFWIQGQLCVARYHADNFWYRGLILQENEDMTYDVLFIDYGNVETCQVSDLRKRIKMHDIPILTHKFQLKGVETLSKDGEWPVTVIDILHSLIVDKKCDVNVLEHPSDPSDPHIITLKLLESNIDVSKFLLDKNLAYIDVSDCDTIPSEIGDNGVFLMSPELGYDSDSEARYVSLTIPDNCDELFIEVTTVCSQTEFFANIILDESLPSGLKKILNEFQDLQQKLTEECSLQPPVENLMEGHPCCCLDFTNNKWCRGEIESFTKSKNSVCVSYVDYGVKEFLHKDFLRECKGCWVELPKMAVKFRLGNVTKCPKVPESDYNKALSSCLKVAPLFVKILKKHNDFLEVNLFNEKDGPLAYQEMIDEGLMEFV